MVFSKNRVVIAILLWSFLMVFPAVMPGATFTLNFVSHPSSTNTPTDGVFGGLNGAPLGTGVIGIPPNPVWYSIFGTSWVSLGQTGDPSALGFVTFPNGTVMGMEHDFFIPYPTILSATLKFLADDTGASQLNGTHLFTASNTQDVTCSAYVPGCLAGTLFSADVTTLVRAGWNGFYSETFQRDLSSMGASWSITVVVSDVAAATPEPATYALIGLGLAGLGILRRRN